MFGVTFGTVVKRIFSVPRLVKMSDLQRILSNNKAAEELLESLKQEVRRAGFIFVSRLRSITSFISH